MVTWATTMVLGWVLSAASASEPANPPEVTLAQVIREAVRRQPILQSSRHARQGAQARLRQTESDYYPHVFVSFAALEGTGLGSSATYLSSPDVPSIGTRPNTFSSDPNLQPYLNTQVALGVHYNVWDFGDRTGRVDAASAMARGADEELAQTEQDVILHASSAYYLTLAAQDAQSIAAESLRRAQEHHALANAGVNSGLKPQIDLARSDAELASVHLALIRAQTQLALSRARLDVAVGWEPQNRRVAAPEQAVDADLEADAQALLQRPDLRALVQQEAAAAGLLEAARARQWPRLTASGSVSAKGWRAAPDVANWDVGLTLTWPAFEGFLYVAQAEEQEAAVASLRAQQRGLLDRAIYQAREARASLLAAKEAVVASHKQVVAAQANLDQAEARYREGLGNIVELTDAQAQSMAAQFTAVQSRLQVALSGVQLTYAYARLRVDGV